MIIRLLRECSGLVCGAALLFAVGVVGQADYEAAKVSEAMAEEARGREVLDVGTLDCLRVRDGLPLRLCVKHCPDGTPFGRWCRIEEFYGAVERRDVM